MTSNEIHKNDILINFIDERIISAEEKRKRNKNRMNICKFSHLALNIISLIFISIITTQISSNKILDFFAIFSTTLSTFSIDLAQRFGFSKRFYQSLTTSAKLRTLKTEFLINKTGNTGDNTKIVNDYMDKIKAILTHQDSEFKIEFEKDGKNDH